MANQIEMQRRYIYIYIYIDISILYIIYVYSTVATREWFIMVALQVIDDFGISRRRPPTKKIDHSLLGNASKAPTSWDWKMTTQNCIIFVHPPNQKQTIPKNPSPKQKQTDFCYPISGKMGRQDSPCIYSNNLSLATFNRPCTLDEFAAQHLGFFLKFDLRGVAVESGAGDFLGPSFGYIFKFHMNVCCKYSCKDWFEGFSKTSAKLRDRTLQKSQLWQLRWWRAFVVTISGPVSFCQLVCLIALLVPFYLLMYAVYNMIFSISDIYYLHIHACLYTGYDHNVGTYLMSCLYLQEFCFGQKDSPFFWCFSGFRTLNIWFALGWSSSMTQWQGSSTLS